MSYPDTTIATGFTFPAVGTGAVSTNSSPTLLISPSTTLATFNFSTLTINGVTKRNVAIPRVKINPGRKYTLTLNVSTPCTTTTLVSNGSSQTFDLNSTGTTTSLTVPIRPVDTALNPVVVLDFTELDNSFNVQFNGRNIVQTSSSNSSTEVQFQNNITNQVRNIRFADGSAWGSGGIPEIWNLRVGTPSNSPVIRVVIDRRGTVSMFGIKQTGGQLFPLELINGSSFNTSLFWRSGTTNNSLVVGQSNASPPTVGKGSVIARRNCQ